MNKYLGFVLATCTLMISCAQIKSSQPDSIKQSDYPGFNIKGNYVWAGAMNLAWKELSDSIIKEPIKLATKDPKVLSQVFSYNHPLFTVKDIQAGSYYIKSGYGQQTVATINREVRHRFPQKSFSDLQLKLGDNAFIAYSYIFKAVQYQVPFAKDVMSFNGQQVQGFTATNPAMRKNLTLLDYKNKDDFVLRIALKGDTDELYLVKGHDHDSVKKIANLTSLFVTRPIALNDQDRFQAPFLSLDAKNEHQDFLGVRLLNTGFEKYRIGAMIERIKFQMDEIGASVENEAVISLVRMSLATEPVKELVFNRPYWVVLKVKGANSPYFILHVNNSRLMKAVASKQ